MYELQLFQGKWGGSIVIPEFKPWINWFKKKMNSDNWFENYQNPTRPLSVGLAIGAGAWDADNARLFLAILVRLSEFFSARARPGIFLILANFHFLNKREVFKVQTKFKRHYSIEAFQHCVTSQRNQRRRWSDFVAQVRCQTLFRANIVLVLRW